jgi:putative endonuclease
MNSEKGKTGENQVTNYYIQKGFTLLQSNFQHYGGKGGGRGRKAEIDLVMTDGFHLVLVEVKYRSNQAFGHPFEQITESQMKRIYKAYQGLISKNPQLLSFKPRIDLAAVMPESLEVWENAFYFD